MKNCITSDTYWLGGPIKISRKHYHYILKLSNEYVKVNPIEVGSNKESVNVYKLI